MEDQRTGAIAIDETQGLAILAVPPAVVDQLTDYVNQLLAADSEVSGYTKPKKTPPESAVSGGNFAHTNSGNDLSFQVVLMRS